MNAQQRDRFLQMAHEQCWLSEDPNTQVGAVLVGPEVGAEGRVIITGVNNFPRKIASTPERMLDRDMKLRLMVHAEMNAVLEAARCGVPTEGATLFLCATDDTGAIWGGPPCCRCTVELIQAGIKRVVSRPGKPAGVSWKWREDTEMAGALLREAGVSYIEVPLPAPDGNTNGI